MVAGNAVLGVSNEENEVVCCEKISGEDSRVALLNSSIVRVRFAGLVFPSLYWRELVGVRANTAAVVGHGRTDGRGPRLALRRNPVLCHVFDESALALFAPLAPDHAGFPSLFCKSCKIAHAGSDVAQRLQQSGVTKIGNAKQMDRVQRTSALSFAIRSKMDRKVLFA